MCMWLNGYFIFTSSSVVLRCCPSHPPLPVVIRCHHRHPPLSSSTVAIHRPPHKRLRELSRNIANKATTLQLRAIILGVNADAWRFSMCDWTAFDKQWNWAVHIEDIHGSMDLFCTLLNSRTVVWLFSPYYVKIQNAWLYYTKCVCGLMAISRHPPSSSVVHCCHPSRPPSPFVVRIKIWFMISKQNFTEPEVAVYIRN